jgi:hypothetical protein
MGSRAPATPRNSRIGHRSSLGGETIPPNTPATALAAPYIAGAAETLSVKLDFFPWGLHAEKHLANINGWLKGRWPELGRPGRQRLNSPAATASPLSDPYTLVHIEPLSAIRAHKGSDPI